MSGFQENASKKSAKIQQKVCKNSTKSQHKKGNETSTKKSTQSQQEIIYSALRHSELQYHDHCNSRN